ncbi:hypothetical protein BT69DRAFT_1315319 [Atractiella rhizophila]|nr:hypothetical protein BT69DRAFT_1315319 [Atractiella rhizophila]
MASLSSSFASLPSLGISSPSRDFARLRHLALCPGGFAIDSTRCEIWPFLLSKEGWEAARRTDSANSTAGSEKSPAESFVHAEHPKEERMESGFREEKGEDVDVKEEEEEDLLDVSALEEHKDEHQVLLDIRRSFVHFPVGLSANEKEALQSRLNDLIVALLRRNPELNYFQGLHDILSVLLLVLLPFSASASPSLVSSPATRHQRNVLYHSSRFLLLHRIRDSLTTTLLPTMGYLRMLLKVVKKHRPSLGEKLEGVGGLPYFSISWVLTLLSHDLDDEEMVKWTFDFLLSRSPGMVIYLGAAMILTRQDQLHSAPPPASSSSLEYDEDDDDPAMLHAQMSKLPTFSPASSPVPPPPSTPSPTPPPKRSSFLSEYTDSMLLDPSASVSPSDLADDAPQTRPATVPPTPPSTSLSTVFALALTLEELYPLSSLADGIMDVNSVLYTWDLSLKSDAEALAIIRTGEGIVKPEPPPVEEKPKRKGTEGKWEIGMGTILVGVAVGVVVVGVYVASVERSGRWKRLWNLLPFSVSLKEGLYKVWEW